jgi:hypothetical protein
MGKSILMRCRHVNGIHSERFSGRIELLLTDLGRWQARLNRARIAAGRTRTTTCPGPVGCCLKTGETIATARRLPCCAVCDDLNDGNGQRTPRLERNRPYATIFGGRGHTLSDLSGGPRLDLVGCTGGALRHILARHAVEAAVPVAQDPVDRAPMLQLLADPLAAYRYSAQDPCRVSEIELVHGEMQVSDINEIFHWSPLT